MTDVRFSPRRLLIAAVGLVYVVVSIRLAEVGGNILGGGCNEPVDAGNETCQAIYPNVVDAWQVLPVLPVAVIALVAIYRSSFRWAHGAFAVGLVLTVLVPMLVFDLLLDTPRR
jgi:hypothetical protein